MFRFPNTACTYVWLSFNAFR